MTLMQRINARFEKRDSDEKGLALLDVLLGMAIFALIVVIGVQNFSTLRNRAYTTQVSSDAKQTATAIQAYMTTPGVTAAPADVAALSSTGAITGVNLTGSNVIKSYTPSGDNFTVCIARSATSGPSALYNSSNSTLSTFASGTCS